jgi:hypothetical protein
MMVLNLGTCLIHMNQNQTFKILSTRSLDAEFLTLLGPNVFATGKESPTFRKMVSLLLQGQALQRKFSSTLLFLTASPYVLLGLPGSKEKYKITSRIICNHLPVDAA